MKKDKIFLLLVFILALFLFTGNVSAEGEDTTCNAVSLNELRTMASNVKITYVPGFERVEIPKDPEFGVTTVGSNYLDIKIYNLTSKLYVVAEATGSNIVNAQTHVISINDVYALDGSATIRQPAQTEMMTYEFTIFSDVYGCTSKTLRTIKLTLPRFNRYSELDACQDIPEYYLCQQYTTYKVDGKTFYQKVDDYKAKLLTQKEEEKEKEENNTGVVSKTISKVSKYKYIVVGVVVAIGVVITIVILKRKKSVL